MISIAVNAVTIILGSLIGLLIKNNVKREITDAIMIGIGLFTVYVGIIGLSDQSSAVIFLLAIVLGGVVGTLFQIEERVNHLAEKIQKRLSKPDGENRFASGFAGFFIISSVGAFTIVASFNAGLGIHSMMYTKSVMDFVVSMAMASSLGIGVLFAGIPVILYECLLAGFSNILSTVLSEAMIEAFSCMGAILTIAIGLNVAKISNIKVVNYIPSLIFAPLLVFLAGLLPTIL